MKTSNVVKDAMRLLYIDKLRKYQIKPIDNILNGNDTMVVAPTSAGKSAIYQIPAIVNSGSHWTLDIGH